MFTKNSKVDPVMREIKESIHRLTQQVDLLLIQDWDNPEMKRWVNQVHFKREREKCKVDAAKRYAELQEEMQYLLQDYPDIRIKKHETISQTDY